MAKRKTNAQAYEDVLRPFYVKGRRHGSKTALAKALGLSGRAVVDRWQSHGIPMKYAMRLKALTGMEYKDIWPEEFR